MAILSKIIAVILDACFSASCIFLPMARAGNPSVKSPGEMFHSVTLSETVVAVNTTGWSRDDKNVLIFLQGITSRDGMACIYIADENYSQYLDAYKAARPEQAFEEFSGMVWDLVARYAPQITGQGFVIYEPSGNDKSPGTNLAATVAAAEGWLGVPADLAQKAEACGLVCKRDLRELKGGPAQQQRTLFKEYKNKLNRAVLVHQPPDNTALRDFGIAQKAFCFFGVGNGENPVEYIHELKLYWDVFAWAKPNAAVFGVWNSTGEPPFVRKLSRASLAVLPADHLYNGSTLMGFRTESALRQPYENRKMEAQPGKHHIALMLSDGDNLQWLVGNAFFNGFIYDRLQSGDEFPVSFTYGPLMAELFPFVAEYHYGLLRPGMQMICGVSGLGYTNILLAPKGTRKAYASLTAQAMQKADLRVMQLLDDVSVAPAIPGVNVRTPFLGLKAKGIINDFAAHKEIQGGVWYMDPNKYESGKGEAYWSGNGKPWLCNRLSFWSPDGTPETATPEWIQSVADAINAYPKDPSRADGYSVINIHPWSINYASLRQLVSLLNEDVVLLSAEELLTMMAENVKR